MTTVIRAYILNPDRRTWTQMPYTRYTRLSDNPQAAYPPYANQTFRVSLLAMRIVPGQQPIMYHKLGNALWSFNAKGRRTAACQKREKTLIQAAMNNIGPLIHSNAPRRRPPTPWTPTPAQRVELYRQAATTVPHQGPPR